MDWNHSNSWAEARSGWGAGAWDGHAIWEREAWQGSHTGHGWWPPAGAGSSWRPDPDYNDEKDNTATSVVKDKFKNVGTLGCFGKHPLPLEDRKDIILGLVTALAPGHNLSRMAVAGWGPEITMAVFWLLTQSGPKTPIRWLRDGEGAFTVAGAVDILKSAATSLYPEVDDLTEAVKFVVDNSWKNGEAIVRQAVQGGFDVSVTVDPQSAQAQPKGGSAPATGAPATGTPRWDSRSGGPPPPTGKVLLRRDTDEEIERLEKQKRMLQLKQEVISQQHALAIGQEPSRGSSSASLQAPPGLIINAGKPASLRGQDLTHFIGKLPPRYFQEPETLPSRAAINEAQQAARLELEAKVSEEAEAHRSLESQEAEAHRSQEAEEAEAQRAQAQQAEEAEAQRAQAQQAEEAQAHRAQAQQAEEAQAHRSRESAQATPTLTNLGVSNVEILRRQLRLAEQQEAESHKAETRACQQQEADAQQREEEMQREEARQQMRQEQHAPAARQQELEEALQEALQTSEEHEAQEHQKREESDEARQLSTQEPSAEQCAQKRAKEAQQEECADAHRARELSQEQQAESVQQDEPEQMEDQGEEADLEDGEASPKRARHTTSTPFAGAFTSGTSEMRVQR